MQTSTRLDELLSDDTPIGYAEIAELLGVAVPTVKSWAKPTASGTRLPDADAPSGSTRRGGRPGRRWRTRTVVAWAIDPEATGSGIAYLRRDGTPFGRGHAS